MQRHMRRHAAFYIKMYVHTSALRKGSLPYFSQNYPTPARRTSVRQAQQPDPCLRRRKKQPPKGTAALKVFPEEGYPVIDHPEAISFV